MAVVAPSEEPDATLLAMLDVLEDDSLWQDNAADLELLLADEFDPEVEVLLAYVPEDELGADEASGR